MAERVLWQNKLTAIGPHVLIVVCVLAVAHENVGALTLPYVMQSRWGWLKASYRQLPAPKRQ